MSFWKQAGAEKIIYQFNPSVDKVFNTINSHFLGQVKEVLAEFEAAVERFPKCVETYALCAQVLNDQQEFDKVPISSFLGR